MMIAFVSVLTASLIAANSTTSVRVKTIVPQEDARVETKITTEVNGQTNTVTNNQPGTVEVAQQNGSVTATIDGVAITPTTTTSASASTAIKPNIRPRFFEKWQWLFWRAGQTFRKFFLPFLPQLK